MSMKPRVGYMCATDFQHEIENARTGATVFPSEEALRANCNCVNVEKNYCGIVKVKVEVIEEIQRRDLT